MSVDSFPLLQTPTQQRLTQLFHRTWRVPNLRCYGATSWWCLWKTVRRLWHEAVVALSVLDHFWGSESTLLSTQILGGYCAGETCSCDWMHSPGTCKGTESTQDDVRKRWELTPWSFAQQKLPSPLDPERWKCAWITFCEVFESLCFERVYQVYLSCTLLFTLIEYPRSPGYGAMGHFFSPFLEKKWLEGYSAEGRYNLQLKLYVKHPDIVMRSILKDIYASFDFNKPIAQVVAKVEAVEEENGLLAEDLNQYVFDRLRFVVDQQEWIIVPRVCGKILDLKQRTREDPKTASFMGSLQQLFDAMDRQITTRLEFDGTHVQEQVMQFRKTSQHVLYAVYCLPKTIVDLCMDYVCMCHWVCMKQKK